MYQESGYWVQREKTFWLRWDMDKHGQFEDDRRPGVRPAVVSFNC